MHISTYTDNYILYIHKGTPHGLQIDIHVNGEVKLSTTDKNSINYIVLGKLGWE